MSQRNVSHINQVISRMNKSIFCACDMAHETDVMSRMYESWNMCMRHVTYEWSHVMYEQSHVPCAGDMSHVDEGITRAVCHVWMQLCPARYAYLCVRGREREREREKEIVCMCVTWKSVEIPCDIRVWVCVWVWVCAYVCVCASVYVCDVEKCRDSMW